MTAIVAGQGLGLSNTSLGLLGPQGQVGSASQGRAGEQVYVNASTGNLVVRQQDEWLIGKGPDVTISRSYNSQAARGDDNGDNWRLGLSRRIVGLPGNPNTAGSAVKRVAEDGSEALYTFDASRGAYISQEGGGSADLLSYDTSSQTWTWTDGDTQTREIYDVVLGGDARLRSVLDIDGNQLALSYADASSYLVTEVATGSADALSGEKVVIVYDTAAGKTSNILSMTTSYLEAGATKSMKRVSYSYETYNGEQSRLQSVTVDLTPLDGSDSAVYVLRASLPS